MITRIKICCIQNIQEAKTAIGFGASAIGLVAKMPSGPGPIPDQLIKEIAAKTPPPIGTFLLTSHTSVNDIIKHHERTNTNTIQIVDYLTDGTYLQLKEALPFIKVVQVIHVINENSIEEAIRVSQSVDAILLDSGNPNLKIKELGGTGRIHNWKLSRKIREKVACPVFLAGGLKPENVREAIEAVEPYAVDVCSGVRSGDLLDVEKLEKFFSAVSKQ
jgi:phosphoribosylanthranilate isomerase